MFHKHLLHAHTLVEGRENEEVIATTLWAYVTVTRLVNKMLPLGNAIYMYFSHKMEQTWTY